MEKSFKKKRYSDEVKKKKAEIARKNLEKAREAKKLGAREKYIKRLEEDIAELEKSAHKAISGLPKEVYSQVKQVIQHELTQKDFSKFLAHDLFQAYTEMGGRETLKKHVKKDPTKFMQFINTLVTLTKQVNEGNGGGNNNVQVVIQGLNPNQEDKNITINTTAQKEE